MLYRLKKTISAGAYLLLAWITWLWFKGDVDWGFSLGCIIVSGLWVGLTWMELGHLFRTYFDWFSRLRITVPLGIGVVLAVLALLNAHVFALKAVAAVELLLWLVVYSLYRRNKAQYKLQGHGPLPKNAWVNPPIGAIKHMSLILTSGNMANRLHATVGHGEVPVIMPDGKMYLFSSYMEKGAILQEAGPVYDKLAARGHYICLELTQPLSPTQLAAVPYIIDILLEQNKVFRCEAQERRTAFFNRLPLPRKAKDFLIKKFRVTGYDWFGLMTGQRHADRYTCIGICLELYHRLGIKTNQYGTGILGLGTGLFDPIMPVRFLSDSAFRIMTEEDRVAYEASQAATAGGAKP